MAERLSEEWNGLIHRMGREREDRIIGGETKLTVAAIFLIEDFLQVYCGNVIIGTDKLCGWIND